MKRAVFCSRLKQTRKSPRTPDGWGLGLGDRRLYGAVSGRGRRRGRRTLMIVPASSAAHDQPGLTIGRSVGRDQAARRPSSGDLHRARRRAIQMRHNSHFSSDGGAAGRAGGPLVQPSARTEVSDGAGYRLSARDGAQIETPMRRVRGGAPCSGGAASACEQCLQPIAAVWLSAPLSRVDGYTRRAENKRAPRSAKAEPTGSERTCRPPAVR